MFKKHLNRSIGGNLFLLLVLVSVASFMLLPVIYSVTTAFKSVDEILIFPPRFFARNPTLNNFIQLADVLSSSWVPISRYVFNSIFVTVIGIVGHVIFASMAAYPMAKHDFVGKKVCNSIITLSLLFTYTVTYIAQYVVYAKIGWLNSYMTLIPGVWESSLGLYLMMNFMSQIPSSLLESARIDGATEMKVWWDIVMPNVKPAWMTISIFAFSGLWNTGGQFIYSENLKLMHNAFSAAAVGGGAARAGAGAAGALILMIPPVVLFLICQSNILETMTTSGMKE